MPPHHWLRFGRTSAEAVGFIADVAEGADLDVVIHQYPAWTKAGYSLKEMLEMVKIPQVKVIKMGTRDMARWLWDYEQLKAARPDLAIITCHDEYLLPTLLEAGDGALIGFAPHLVAVHIDSGAFQAVQQSIPLRAALKKIISPALDRVLPAAFGWSPPIFPDHVDRVAGPTGLDLGFGLAWLAFLALLTAFSLRDFVRRWRQEQWPRLDTSLVFLGVSWICFVLFADSYRSHSHTYRYFIPLVWSFPFLMAYGYRRTGTVGRPILTALTILLLALNLMEGAATMRRWAKPDFSDYLKCYGLKPVFQYLDQRGINRCYGTYADAYRITFETDERIICSQPYNERFPGWHVPFKDIVDPAANAAFVLSDTYKFLPRQLEEDMVTMQVRGRKETCGHYEVYTDFEPPPFPSPGPEIPATSLAITTSHYPEGAAALHDGSYVKRWRSHQSQEKGMWIEIRLPSAHSISQMSFYYNQYRYDRARAMRLLAHDGQTWTNVVESISHKLDCFEFLNGHPVYGNEMQTIRFPAVTTDRLRLEILKPEPGRDWTIGEIRVFEAR
jgi:hypothetical protein